jgi:DnaJ like chaperone protein
MFLSVSMLGKLAYIDGRPRRAELSCLRRFVFSSGWNNWLEVAEVIFHVAGRVPNHNNMAFTAFKVDANAFARLFRNHRANVKTVGDELLLMATADGPINYLERQLLDLFSEKAGWARTSDRYENFDSERESEEDGDDIDSCYVMLKCSQEDSDTHIRNLYRQLAKEYHPDTIQGKGLPEDFVLFANKRFQEIQESYERIMDHRRKRMPL